MNEPVTSQRIDKWLWHARITKTRSLAQKLVTGGKVRLDREKITNSSCKVNIGSVLTVTLSREIKILEIIAFADKRGPYSTACTLYNDLSPPKPQKHGETNDTKTIDGLVAGPRPTKHQRKEAMRLKRNPNNS
ncbi:MAG: RNA-binding S4 domain-containing protein [Rhizobiaceae bacterium]|nr:RNA-binding S4 domain-containing protein [Rhizobiaceae bacterium]